MATQKILCATILALLGTRAASKDAAQSVPRHSARPMAGGGRAESWADFDGQRGSRSVWWGAGGGPGFHGSYYTPTTRMEIRTWRSAIADLKGTPPGAPSSALREGAPGWVWRCDAAISRYKEKNMPFCTFFTCSQKISKWRHAFSLISKVFDHI